MKAVSLASLQFESKLRRYVSAGIALSLIFGIIALPISMLSGYLQRSAEIEELQLDLSRLRERPASPEASRNPVQSADATPTGIFSLNAEAAGSHIQATLRNLAVELGTAEIRVESVRVLPPIVEGGATAIRASASLTVPGGHIFDVINALEASNPPIGIDSLRIISRSDASATRARGLPTMDLVRGELTLVLRVYVQADNSLPPSSRQFEGTASGKHRLP